MLRASFLLVAVCLGLVLLHAPAASAQGNGNAEVQHDCTCQCCKADTCATEGMKEYKVAAGSKDKCTDAFCRSSFYACPDVGSHESAGGIVVAKYHDCTCSCCKEGTCGTVGLKEYTFLAGSSDKCTPEKCSSEFYSCPDPGSHNADAAGTANDALVFATYHDCMCACCKEGECPTLKYNLFHAGSPDKCSAAACSSKFFSCPDTGAHNAQGSVVAHFSGSPPPPPAYSSPVTSASPHVGKEETVMPTYGVALLSIVLIGLFCAVVGVFVHRRVQRERGFRWVHFDDMAGKGAQGNGVSSAENGIATVAATNGK